MASVAVLQLLDTVQGGVFLAIMSAMDVLQIHNLDLSQFKLEVLDWENQMLVMLVDNNNPDIPSKMYSVLLEPRKEFSYQEINPLQLDKNKLPLIATIRGDSFFPIKKAVEVFQQHGFNIVGYNIELIREHDSLFVLFADKDQSPDTLGSIGKPGFEVEMKAGDISVVRSNFVR